MNPTGPTLPSRTLTTPQRFLLGVSLSPSSSASATPFLNSHTLVLPAGRHLWKLSTHSPSTEHICLRPHAHPDPHLASVPLQPDIVLVAETVTSAPLHAHVSLIRISQKQVLWQFRHPSPGRVSTVAVSAAGRMLAVVVQTPANQSILALWRRDKKALLCTMTLNHTITHASFNPEDNSLLCLSGKHFLRIIKVSMGSISDMPLLRPVRERSGSFPMHVWLGALALVTLTSTADVLLFVGGELKQTISPSSNEDKTFDGQPISIALCESGFVCGTTFGFVVVYRYFPDDRAVEISRAFPLPDADTTPIVGVHVSPCDKHIACSLEDGRIVTLSMAPRKSQKKQLSVKVSGGWDHRAALIEPKFHNSLFPLRPLTLVATQEQRGLVIGCTDDDMLHVWHRIEEATGPTVSEIRSSLSDHPIALSVHPSALHFAVGFETRLEIMYVLQKGMRRSHTITLKSGVSIGMIMLLEYSHAGHLLAVAVGADIYVYETIQFTLISSMQLNRGLATAMHWTYDDTFLAVGSDAGDVKAWHVRSAELVRDHGEKHAVITALTFGTELVSGDETDEPLDNKAISELDCSSHILFARTRHEDNGLFVLTTVERSDELTGVAAAAMPVTCSNLQLQEHSFTALRVDVTRGIVVAGTSLGHIVVLAWPFLPHPADPFARTTKCLAVQLVHSSAVSDLRVFRTHGTLLSSSRQDGITAVGVIKQPASMTVAPHLAQLRKIYHDPLSRFLGDADVLLVDRQIWSRMDQAIQHHRQELEQVTRKAHLRLSATVEKYNEDIRKLRTEMDAVTTELDQKVLDLQGQLQDQRRRADRSLVQVKAEADRTLSGTKEELENQLIKVYRLLDEHKQQNQVLAAQAAEEREQLEAQYKVLLAAKQRELDKAMQDQCDMEERYKAQLERQEKQHEEALAQAEAEHDKQVAALRKDSEAKTTAHRHAQAELSADMVAAERELAEAQESVEHMKSQMEALNVDLKNELEGHTATKLELEKMKDNLRERIDELNGCHQQLANARSKNQSLRTFQLVLEEQLRELHKRQQPAEEEIQRLSHRLMQMEAELLVSNKKVQTLSTTTSQREQQLKTQSSELQDHKLKLRDRTRQLKQVKAAVAEIVETKHKRDWPEHIVSVYAQYVSNKPVAHVQHVEPSSTNLGLESLKHHRDILENKVHQLSSLQRFEGERLKKHRSANVRQNTWLLQEVNELRGENRELKMRLREAELHARNTKASARLERPASTKKPSTAPAESGKRQRVEQSRSLSALLTNQSRRNRQSRSARKIRGAGLPTPSRRAGGAGGPGRIIRGSTRPMTAVASLHHTVHELEQQLGKSQQQIMRQRMQISSLKMQTKERTVRVGGGVGVELPTQPVQADEPAQAEVENPPDILHVDTADASPLTKVLTASVRVPTPTHEETKKKQKPKKSKRRRSSKKLDAY